MQFIRRNFIREKNGFTFYIFTQIQPWNFTGSSAEATEKEQELMLEKEKRKEFDDKNSSTLEYT